MSEISISTVQEEIDKLEIEIYNLISKFEIQSDCTVSNISMNRLTTMSYKKGKIFNVDLTVEIN